MNDNKGDDCHFSTEVSIIKKTMAEVMAQFLAAGFSREAIIVSLGSLAGNVIGGTVPEENWPHVFETMKKPMMADAKRAKTVMEMMTKPRN